MKELKLELQEWMTDRIDENGEVYVEYSAIIEFPKQWKEEIGLKTKDLKARNITVNFEEVNDTKQLVFEISGYRNPNEKELEEAKERRKKELETTLRAAIKEDPSMAANILQEYL